MDKKDTLNRQKIKKLNRTILNLDKVRLIYTETDNQYAKARFSVFKSSVLFNLIIHIND